MERPKKQKPPREPPSKIAYSLASPYVEVRWYGKGWELRRADTNMLVGRTPVLMHNQRFLAFFASQLFHSIEELRR